MWDRHQLSVCLSAGISAHFSQTWNFSLLYNNNMRLDCAKSALSKPTGVFSTSKIVPFPRRQNNFPLRAGMEAHYALLRSFYEISLFPLGFYCCRAVSIPVLISAWIQTQIDFLITGVTMKHIRQPYVHWDSTEWARERKKERGLQRVYSNKRCTQEEQWGRD